MRQHQKEELLDCADKYGLVKLTGKKILVEKQPLQITSGKVTYNLSVREDWYCNDINQDLYDYIIEEYNNNAEVKMRITKEMVRHGFVIQYAKYTGKQIDLSNLKKCFNDFKVISYNPENNDKFIAGIDTYKKFIHIYEFKVSPEINTAKYIHAIYDEENNIIEHMDYSINTYSDEQYKAILEDPTSEIPKVKEHIKIWRIDGKIKIEKFYKIIFSMFENNEKYIRELFKI